MEEGDTCADSIIINSTSKMEIFNKHNKLNLLNYIFDFLLYEEVLKISSLNSHIYNHIKKKKCTDQLRIIKCNYLSISQLNPALINLIKDFKSSSVKILNEVKVDFIIIFEYLALYAKKNIFKNNYVIKSAELQQSTFLSNIIEHTQFYSTSKYFFLKFDSPYEECKPYTSEKYFNKKNTYNTSLNNWKFDIELMCKSLFNNHSLILSLGELDISNNKLKDECLELILPFLFNKSKVLYKLDLSANQLSTSEISKLFLNLMVEEKSIKDLNLSENNFDENSVENIISIYKSNQNTIEQFYVYKNKFQVNPLLQTVSNDKECNKNRRIYLSYLYDPLHIFLNGKIQLLFRREFSYNFDYRIEHLENLIIDHFNFDSLDNHNKDKFYTIMNDIFTKYKSSIFKLTLNLKGISDSCLDYLYKKLRDELLDLKFPIKLTIKFNEKLELQNDILKHLVNIGFNKLKLENIVLKEENVNLIINIILKSKIERMIFTDINGLSNSLITDIYSGLKFSNISKIKFINCKIDEKGKQYLLKCFEVNSNLKEILFE
jgi:hypothetical protein